MRVLVYLLVLWGHVVKSILAQHADTWDYCECHWDSWKSWSDCDGTCFGEQIRSRDVLLTNYDGCDEFEDCDYGEGGWERQGCNEVCHNSGTPTGRSSPSCTCRTGNYGDCCKNTVDCGHPGEIVNGDVHLTTTNYASRATYTCNQFFNLTDGDSVMTCQENSAWSGTKPKCVFVNTCASNPCQNQGTCVDGLNMYTCLCGPGWNGENCQLDVQPPLINKCPDDIIVNATQRTTDVVWKEPEFSDPFGNAVDITTNYPQPEFTFPWGDFTVQYVATKVNNGLSTECTFLVRVRPTPCEELNIPENGARICNGWEKSYGRVCIMACKEGYTLPSSKSYERLYVCGASGNWIYPAPMPNCSVAISSLEDALIYQPEQISYTFVSCDDEASTTKLKQKYIDVLKQIKELSSYCSSYPEQCHLDNVEINCV